MNLIAEGGISTKNTLVNTKGAVSLSLNVSYIDGISLNVAYTKDEVFIIADKDLLMFSTKGTGYIVNDTYNDLLHYNVGTKVLSAQIVTLNEVLSIYSNTNKMLVLNLGYQGDRTAQYTYQLIDLVNSYPNVNIYLKSDNEEILNILTEVNTKARIGVVINDDNIEEMYNDYDFYSLNSHNVNKDIILKRINANKDTMFEHVKDINEVIGLYYKYDKYILYSSYIITNNPKGLYDDFNKLDNYFT